MPELPEVESIKRSLSSNIVGQKLKNYKIYDHRTNRYNTKKPTINESLLGISRKGKLLIFDPIINIIYEISETREKK